MAIKSLAQKADAIEEGVEMTTTTPGGAPEKPKAQSKAKSFDEVSEGSDVKDGKYEAIVKEFILQDPIEGKGQSVRFTVVIASEDFRGESITGWFKIFEDQDQEVAAKGAKFFKKACTILGYTVTQANLEEVCEQITQDQPGVLIQKKTNEGFDNVYFNGLIEDSPAIRATHDAGFLNF